MNEFKSWAVLELLGHRKLAGYVTEQEVAGAKMLRLDVPHPDGPRYVENTTLEDFAATQFYSPAALYCLTPVAESVARGFAQRAQPAPVSQWELPQPAAAASPATDDDEWPLF